MANRKFGSLCLQQMNAVNNALLQVCRTLCEIGFWLENAALSVNRSVFLSNGDFNVKMRDLRFFHVSVYGKNSKKTR